MCIPPGIILICTSPGYGPMHTQYIPTVGLGFLRASFSKLERRITCLLHCPRLLPCFRSLHNGVTSDVKKSKKSLFRNLNPSNKNFWKRIKCFNKNTSSLPTLTNGQGWLSWTLHYIRKAIPHIGFVDKLCDCHLGISLLLLAHISVITINRSDNTAPEAG